MTGAPPFFFGEKYDGEEKGKAEKGSNTIGKAQEDGYKNGEAEEDSRKNGQADEGSHENGEAEEDSRKNGEAEEDRAEGSSETCAGPQETHPEKTCCGRADRCTNPASAIGRTCCASADW
jgi:hypothetical protein